MVEKQSQMLAYTNPNVTGLIYIAAYIATPATAQNMTGDNATMMGGNMTAGNMTGGSTGSRTIH